MEQIIDVALNDPGHQERMTYETSTAILAGEQLNNGTIEAVTAYNGQSVDVGIKNQILEIKSGGEIINKSYGVEYARRLVEEKSQQMGAPVTLLIGCFWVRFKSGSGF